MRVSGRLRRLASHLRAATAAAEQEEAAVVPLQLHAGLVDGQLTPLPGALEAVGEAMRAAGEAGDYRRAVELQDLLYVAEKKELLTVEECAPPTPEECGEFFMQNGFVGAPAASPPGPSPLP